MNRSESWFPPPLALPGSVDDVGRLTLDVVLKSLGDPPALSGAALSASCENLAESVPAALREGQEAFVRGEIGSARRTLEPAGWRHPHAAALAGLACYALGRVSRAILWWHTIERHIGEAKREPSLYHSLIILANAHVKQNPQLHPEADYMSLLCSGRGIDVGCGGNKTCPEAIGVDLTPHDEKGVHGGQAGVDSTADIVASGDHLPMFETGELDFVIARHNLEHYKDHIKALQEWTRVLKPGGLMGVITPDHEWVDTISLDPTHYHVFTIKSLDRLFGLLPGLSPVWSGVAAPRWSIMMIAQKAPAQTPFDFAGVYADRERDRIRVMMEAHSAGGRGGLAGQCRMEMDELDVEAPRTAI